MKRESPQGALDETSFIGIAQSLPDSPRTVVLVGAARPLNRQTRIDQFSLFALDLELW
jgi:hypothetical protein